MAGPRGRDGDVGLWGVVAIGVGGMVGGGIFAVLGLSVLITGGGAPIAFLVAGMVALLTASQRGSAAWISLAAAAACTGALAALIARSSLGATSVLGVMVALSFGIEAAFRRVSGRMLRIEGGGT
ncbi:MAG TPA: hypothetical protein VF984_05310 [Actinomycetota bacterium]